MYPRNSRKIHSREKLFRQSLEIIVCKQGDGAPNDNLPDVIPQHGIAFDNTEEQIVN